MHIKYMYRCINTHAVYISMKVYNLHVYNVHMQCIHLLLYLSIYIIPSYKNPIQSYQYIHTHTVPFHSQPPRIGSSENLHKIPKKVGI